MNDVTAAMAKNTNQYRPNEHKAASENTALDCRYGQIGISAVAAAVRYQGGNKNPAYAPASSAWCDRFAEAAA